jgi:hypothetical protein
MRYVSRPACKPLQIVSALAFILRIMVMTTGSLLWRGMIVGFVAALLAFGILKVVGEPAVDRAIAFESAMDEAKAKAEHDAAVA